LSSGATPAEVAEAAVERRCHSIAFTYNDPIIFAEYAIDTALACRAAGLKNVAVTSGYITPEARRDFFAPLDAANVDLKAFTEGFYKRLCFAELAPVLDTLAWLKRETEVWLEVTTLLIEGHNDSDDELARLSDWFAEHLGPDTPLHFSAFHPDFRMRDVPATRPATLTRARAIARAAGLRYVYTGNVHDPAGDATRCPGCDTLLIQRDWYELLTWTLRDGHCPHCDQAIAGVWDPEPGRWGARRQPLRMR
jgi:pyruvate formate lyase activating enzyme